MPNLSYVQVATHVGEGKMYRYISGINPFPTGFEQPAYDDSEWISPVFAALGTTAFPPAQDPSQLPGVQAWGDPLYITGFAESVATALLLYRFHLNVPDGNLWRLSYADVANPTAGGGTVALVAQPTATGHQGWLNGLGGGIALTNAWFQEHLLIGDNLIAVLVPSFSTPPGPPALSAGRWVSLLFQLAYQSAAGRSSVQFVG